MIFLLEMKNGNDIYLVSRNQSNGNVIWENFLGYHNESVIYSYEQYYWYPTVIMPFLHTQPNTLGPVLANNMVIIAVTNATAITYIQSFDMNSGKNIWSTRTNDTVSGLYLGLVSGMFAALESQTLVVEFMLDYQFNIHSISIYDLNTGEFLSTPSN